MSTDPTSPESARSAVAARLGLKSGDRLTCFGRQVLELLLPSTCRLCDRCVAAGVDFCDPCRVQLQASEPLMRFACRRCGRPGAGLHATCRQCQGQEYAFDECLPLWTYDGLVRNAVVASKYGSQTALATALGRRLGRRVLASMGSPHKRETLQPDPNPALLCIQDPPDVVTYVPSHLWRRVQRGAGGSRVLACAVARTLAAKTLSGRAGAGRASGGRGGQVRFCDLLTSVRRIKKQALLGEQQRLSNVRGAFAVAKTPWRRTGPSWLEGMHVLLVDDVMTTGATAGENARILKAAGVRRVTVAVVARACTT